MHYWRTERPRGIAPQRGDEVGYPGVAEGPVLTRAGRPALGSPMQLGASEPQFSALSYSSAVLQSA